MCMAGEIRAPWISAKVAANSSSVSPWEAADQVGGESGPVKVPAQEPAGLQKSGRRCISGSSAARWRRSRTGGPGGSGGTGCPGACRPAAEVLGDGPGLQAAQPHPAGRGRAAHRFDQVDEGFAGVQVAAPAGDLDAGDHDLVVARLGQGVGLTAAAGMDSLRTGPRVKGMMQ